MNGVETCFLCGPEAKERLAAVAKTDSIALCNGHWNRWLITFVGPFTNYDPPCGAHVIFDAPLNWHAEVEARADELGGAL